MPSSDRELHLVQFIAGAMDLYHQAIDLASNPKHTRWLSPLLLLADAVLCALIIWKIPCELWSPSSCANQTGSSFAQPVEGGADAQYRH